MKSSAPEYVEQYAFVQWCRANRHKYPGLDLIHASANGAHLAGTAGQRAAKMAKMKNTGFRNGIPDLFLPVARGGCHGLFVEMKSASGRASDEQKYWIEKLNNQGYMAVIAKGHSEAIRFVEEYYRGGA